MALIETVSRLIGASGLASWGRARGPVLLMYHGIGGEDGTPAETFARQLDLLSETYEIVSLSQALANTGAPNFAAITFDDGYRDFRELAVPALATRRLHATVFVPAAHIGGSNVWDQGMAPKRELMSASELRELDPEVVEVGVHGMEHRRLAGLAPAELERETREAKQVVEAALGRPVRFFAYPYGQLGDFDRAAERAVQAAGFQAACSTHFGRGTRSDERFRLRRVGITPTDTNEIFLAKLSGAYDWLAAKERIGWWLRRAGLRR